MRGRSSLLTGGWVLLLYLVLPARATAQGSSFPHRRHEGLFPLCSGCHTTSASAPTGITFPEPRVCARCHDGTERQRVEWRERPARASNLRFTHAEHPMEGKASDPSSACETCHREPGSSTRMAVTEARPRACLSCHEHQAPEHLSPEASCRRCHVPLTEARSLTAARIARLPQPASHDEGPTWLAEHGAAARESLESCRVCHARESCERCHLNAGSLEAVQGLGRDPRVADLVQGRAPEYPEPSSHEGGDWSWRHRDVALAEGLASCANCHARSSCRACHLESGTTSLDELPAPDPRGLRGVDLGSRRRAVHPPGFERGHEVQASAAEAGCESCHQKSTFCVSCHAGGSDPGFHLDDFLSQHAVEAYGNEADCASCHNPELFCRSCHKAIGLASSGRLDGGFHNAQPFWLLEHGEGARKGLESCTTCHAQNDCAQCHSARGGWRVNPHGPDFDARRMREQAPLTCLRCHFGDPLGGGG